MDPIQLLKRQHRQVESLFKSLQKTEDPEERREGVQELQRSLELHMRIEEEIFYPAVREVELKKAEEMVLESYEEHHVTKLALAELPRLDPADERFHAKAKVLEELVRHHVEEEEKELFRIAKKLGTETLDELGERMSAEAGEGREAAELESEDGAHAAAGAGRGRRPRRK